MSRQRVLFLCTSNSARSQMAEAFLRRYAGDLFEIHSAGLSPTEIDPLTVQVMHEVGIELSNQRSKGIGVYFGTTLFQYLITVCNAAGSDCPGVWPGVHTRIHSFFEDPAECKGTEAERLAKFREVRNRIENKIRGWVAKQTFMDPERIRASLSAAKSRSF